jgi:hypothetical protein
MNSTLVIKDFDKNITKYNFLYMSYLKYFSLFLVEKIINLLFNGFNKKSKYSKKNNDSTKGKKHVTFDKNTIFKTENDTKIINYTKKKFIFSGVRNYSNYRVERLKDRDDLSDDEPLYF